MRKEWTLHNVLGTRKERRVTARDSGPRSGRTRSQRWRAARTRSAGAAAPERGGGGKTAPAEIEVDQRDGVLKWHKSVAPGLSSASHAYSPGGPRRNTYLASSRGGATTEDGNRVVGSGDETWWQEERNACVTFPPPTLNPNWPLSKREDKQSYRSYAPLAFFMCAKGINNFEFDASHLSFEPVQGTLKPSEASVVHNNHFVKYPMAVALWWVHDRQNYCGMRVPKSAAIKFPKLGLRFEAETQECELEA
ncbi:hypothetical protein DFH09DRAFT_1435981 [Mycena vulgaris]|nr:hypothetical protein DFH09DRAFT_1435981 [Mycena vulgaris]